jgi:hypothetical protein
MNDKMIVFKNKFHNSTAKIHEPENKKLSRKEVEDIWEKLCGNGKCGCFNSYGVLGETEKGYTMNHDGSAILG